MLANFFKYYSDAYKSTQNHNYQIAQIDLVLNRNQNHKDNICRHIRITNTLGETEWARIHTIKPLFPAQKKVEIKKSKYAKKRNNNTEGDGDEKFAIKLFGISKFLFIDRILGVLDSVLAKFNQINKGRLRNKLWFLNTNNLPEYYQKDEILV